MNFHCFRLDDAVTRRQQTYVSRNGLDKRAVRTVELTFSGRKYSKNKSYTFTDELTVRGRKYSTNEPYGLMTLKHKL